MWKSYTKVLDDPVQRRAALSSLLEEDDFDVPECEDVSKQLADDFMGDIPDVELRRLVVRAIHRLSREAKPDSPIITAPIMKRMADVSVIQPYEEEPEVAEYALRAMNNIVVHNKELANEIDEATMRALFRCIRAMDPEEPDLADKVCSIAARSLQKFVDPDTGRENGVKLDYDMTVESALSPLWLLIANLSEHSIVLREVMEEHFFERAETDKPDRPPTKPKFPHLGKMLTSEQYPLLSFSIGNAMFQMGNKNARVMLNRFGIEASAGILYTIGEQMKLEREMEERRNQAEIDEDEEQLKAKVHAVDDDMTAEQFYEMMSALGNNNIIRPENPVQRAHEEGYLEKIEEELRQLDIEEQKREDEELQRAVDEWSKSKMRRTVGSSNLSETEEPEAEAVPVPETSAQGQSQGQAKAESVEKSS
ncbi:hypothetical protein MBRA1_001698 [Malassezia brasiliensis]|uniref:Uncharacterized protein n=1 Tax=Malassezia brasiliensis TaxID=1821822 RepID=A0AAF0INI9_9BASI|nr:hypothetical protein MBRA1_001698 [Malassezia brasiliensis]